MATLAQLESRVRAQLDAVGDDPQGRYDLRVAFYAQHGHGTDVDPHGFGAAELAFLRWELRRGVLQQVDSGGSPWWRACQRALAFDSRVAAAIVQEGCDEPVPTHIQHWVDYLYEPAPKTWYRAHNTSIVTAYDAQVTVAHDENDPEQAFLNEVLYRLIYAQALVEGAAEGIVGEVGADPRLFSVDFITHLHGLYPVDYPLEHRDIEFVHHVARGPEAALEDVLDLDLILPNIDRLYGWAAELNQTPVLERMVVRGRPIYPHYTTAEKPAEPRRIAVLGGGMAALSAVYELTRYPDWQSYYAIDVYQLGWRLGGKTATGRGPHDRIEERGLHIFQGWYDNAFRLVQQAYAERRGRGLAPDSPFTTWEDAFLRNDGTLLTEHLPDRGWVPWPVVFPRTAELPGMGPSPTIWEQIRKVLGLLLETLFGSPYSKHFMPVVGPFVEGLYAQPERKRPEGMFETLIEGVEHVVEEVVDGLLGHDAREAHAMAQHLVGRIGAQDAGASHRGRPLVAEPLPSVFQLLEHIIDVLITVVDDTSDHLRRTILAARLGLVNLRGVIEDCWDGERFDFDRINHLDYREWLASKGATPDMTGSVIVRFFYTGTFANQADGRQQGGAMAAGLALRGVLAAFGYKGSFVWQTRAGTGDTLVMPIYQVLAARGVRFHWFHRVRHIPFSTTGQVEQVEIDVQAELADPSTPYDPAIGCAYGDDAMVDAWPAHPRYDQLRPEQARALQERGIDLEDPWSGWEPVGTRTLVRGQDFDDVILAIPVSALASICDGFRQDERWAGMFDHVRTTMTMAAQIYLKPSMAQMGYRAEDWGMAPTDCALNLVTYADPQYSWVDTSQVLPAESWPADQRPQAVGLFCGSMGDPAVPAPPPSARGVQQRLNDEVRILTRQWVRDNMGWFLPDAAPPANPAGLDLALLADASGGGATGEAVWDSQYFWVNAAPDLRYTLSVPGSNRYRLKTDQTGLDNLFLAGDWIDFGVNVGYMEGTVISGLQAAQALMRRDEVRQDTQPIWGAELT